MSNAAVWVEVTFGALAGLKAGANRVWGGVGVHGEFGSMLGFRGIQGCWLL